MSNNSEDSYNLTRYLLAQRNTYDQAISEVRSRRKIIHWMWFIFPQYAGLGFSYESKLYAINSLDEARSFLEHPILGPRLMKASEACLEVKGGTANEIFGPIDELKLCSSVTLFAQVSELDSVFHKTFEKYFDGNLDVKTLELLRVSQGNFFRIAFF